MALLRSTRRAAIARRPAGSVWYRRVRASAGDPLNDLFATEFFEIVGSVAGAVRKRALFAEKAHPSGEVGGGEAVGRGGQGDECFNDVAHARLVEIDATDEGLADA